MEKGQTYVLLKALTGPTASGYSRGTISEGSTVRVTNIRPDGSLWIRGKRANKSYYDNDEVTIVVPSDQIQEYVQLDPNAPRPRRLGEVPEGDFIAPSDPRIAWIWDDAAAVANAAGHCAQYDSLCDKLGVPGRERDFTIKRTVNGFDVSKKFKARSKQLAEEMFDSELKVALA